MPTVVVEENIEFTFSDNWVVAKYDDHPDTKSHVGKVEGRKAVDFIGLYDGTTFFIEVKDFRGFRIHNKPKIGGELHLAIAQKVHDTVAGLVLTHRRMPAAQLWRDSLKACRSEDGNVCVILWLEDDSLFKTNTAGGKAKASIFLAELKRHLRWFPGRVFVVNDSFNAGALPDTTVRDFPGAAGHGGSAARKKKK